MTLEDFTKITTELGFECVSIDELNTWWKKEKFSKMHPKYGGGKYTPGFYLGYSNKTGKVSLVYRNDSYNDTYIFRNLSPTADEIKTAMVAHLLTT